MAAIGGSIEEVSIKGRSFTVTGDNGVQLDLGGYSNESPSNGNGTSRLLKTRKPPGLEGLMIVVDQDRDDQEFLQDVADLKTYVDVTVTYASGATYEGKAQITGDLKYSNDSATCSINLSGQGKFKKQ